MLFGECDRALGRRVKAIARDALGTLTGTLDGQRCP